MEINPDTLEIEIVGIEPIDGGVQVFARAWNDGVQIGFGKDGTVDIERFRIFNPPVLVPSENGEIERQTTIYDIESGEETILNFFLTEDAEQALLLSLQEIIKKVGKPNAEIVPGKIGNTTSTFYSGGGDGGIELSGTWTTIFSSGTGNADHTSTEKRIIYYADQPVSNSKYCSRLFFPFDTSALPDGDTISSATMTIYVASNSSTTTERSNTSLIATTQASDTSLQNDDWIDVGTTKGAADVDVGTTSNKQVVYTLNSTGIGWINKTGFTRIGIRAAYDISQTTIPDVQFKGLLAYVRMSDYTGTTYDPYLVVEHSAGGGAPAFIPRGVWIN